MTRSAPALRNESINGDVALSGFVHRTYDEYAATTVVVNIPMRTPFMLSVSHARTPGNGALVVASPQFAVIQRNRDSSSLSSNCARGKSNSWLPMAA